MLLTHWLLTPLVASQLVLTLNCTGAIGLAHWCPSQMLWIWGNPPALSVLFCQLLMRNCKKKQKKVQTKEVPKKKIQDPPKKDWPNLSQEAVVGRTHCLCSHHCGALSETIVWRSSNNYMVILWCLHVKLVKLMPSSQTQREYKEFIVLQMNLTIGRCCKGFEVIRAKCFLLAIQANL